MPKNNVDPLYLKTDIPDVPLVVTIQLSEKRWVLSFRGTESEGGVKLRKIPAQEIILWDSKQDIMGSLAYRVYCVAIILLQRNVSLEKTYEKTCLFAKLIQDKLIEMDKIQKAV